MQIITGIARGRKIKMLEGVEVRPTSQKVKEAIFSAIQFEIEGASVLDLFCGSGQLGIEALSRGARFCVFVDSSRASHELTKENVVSAGLFKASRVVAMDFKAFLSSTTDKFDLVFADPPYSQGMAQEALSLLTPLMNEGGVIMMEHDERDIMPESEGGFKLKKQYRFGRITVSSYRG